MKRFTQSLTLFFAIILGFTWAAQSQNRDYFAHKIIIKYKTDAQLRSIRAKTHISPKQQVQRMLQEVGLTDVKPVFSFRNHPALKTTPNSGLKRSAQNLSRIVEVTYAARADAKILAAKLNNMPGVAYAEPKYIRRMQFTPNDPIANPYEDYHHFREAWEVARGSSGVIIAVVDGGVNYRHPELDSKLWVNTAEINPNVRAQVDKNGNGVINSTEVMQFLSQNGSDYDGDGSLTLSDALAPNSPLLTGSDTDGNGYADDIFGWDFWQSGGVNGQPITQDNDPISDGTDHGAHVAGIATAETNNGLGIAGTGFNSRYMAVKAGGIPDDPSTEDDESRSIGFGYEGIMYAAMEGADVINCSWGGGGFSAFEKDVIHFATEAGALVVAASGNAAANTVDFPSAYKKTLSVGSVEPTDNIASYSNIGYNMDVFATGSGIQSSGFGDRIVTKSGTSMSTPVAAGLAGLLKAQHPNWRPLRIAGQIRSSATYLDDTRPREGHGKLDAFQAVTTNLPAVRVLSAHFNDKSGGKLGLNEDGTIRLQIINYGKATANLNVQIESLARQGITLQNPSKNISTLATGDRTSVSFAVAIAETYDLNNIPTFRLSITDNNEGYSDFDIVQYSDILYDVVDANNIKTSFGGNGTIGFTDPLAGRGGVGFITRSSNEDSFDNDRNLLFEGGLMIEANGTIFDVVRGENNNADEDFNPLQTFVVNKNGAISAQDGHTEFSFKDEAGAVAGKIQLDTYAFARPELSNVVYLKYRLTNTSSSLPIKDIYAGLFNDWDIGNTVNTNSVDYSRQDSILYISDEAESSETPIVAVAHLGPISSVLAINNFPDTPPDNPAIDLSDGFSDTEKSAALKAGTNRTRVASADVSAVTASGPYTLNPNSTLTVGFVYAFGSDLQELRRQIQAARQQAPFSVSPTGVVISDRIPEETDLLQNFPNPFSGKTTIRLDLKEDADVKLIIYDVLGRKVRVLQDGRMEAKEYYIPFMPKNLSSGVYYLHLQTKDKTKTVAITYIK